MKDIKIVDIIKKIPETINTDIEELKSNKHNHTNLSALNLITEEKISKWDTAADYEPDPEWGHTHKNKAVLDLFLPSHIETLNALPTNLAGKADKEHTHENYQLSEPGKGLSTEDFTSAFKIKLESLSSFDGSYATLTGLPDLSQYTNTSTVNQLIDSKLETINSELKTFVKTETYNTDMSQKADKTHSHSEYRTIADSYSKSSVDELLSGKATTSHTHDNYQPKEAGKGLSEVNFTNEYKEQLDALLAGSGDTKIDPEKIQQNASYRFVTDSQINDWTAKASTSYVEEKLSQTTNSINEYVSSQISSLSNIYVKKEDGKGLSSNDYTSDEKSKLAGIENNANNYTHPSTHSSDEIMIGDKTLTQAIKDGDIGGGGGVSGVIFDSNSAGRTGEGQLTSDTNADTGKSITITSSTEKVLSEFEIDATKIKLGKYSIGIRMKISNNSSSSNVMKIDILKKASGGSTSNIRTINFTGTNFEHQGTNYSWLTSWFDYKLAKSTGDKLIIKVSTTSTSSLSYGLDYITINPMMSAQYSLA